MSCMAKKVLVINAAIRPSFNIFTPNAQVHVRVFTTTGQVNILLDTALADRIAGGSCESHAWRGESQVHVHALRLAASLSTQKRAS